MAWRRQVLDSSESLDTRACRRHPVGMASTWRPADTFGARLLLVRHEKKMSVEVAAHAAGVPPASWSSWERGSLPRDMPTVTQKISSRLDVDRDWLMWGGSLRANSFAWNSRESHCLVA